VLGGGARRSRALAVTTASASPRGGVSDSACPVHAAERTDAAVTRAAAGVLAADAPGVLVTYRDDRGSRSVRRGVRTSHGWRRMCLCGQLMSFVAWPERDGQSGRPWSRDPRDEPTRVRQALDLAERDALLRRRPRHGPGSRLPSRRRPRSRRHPIRHQFEPGGPGPVQDRPARRRRSQAAPARRPLRDSTMAPSRIAARGPGQPRRRSSATRSPIGASSASNAADF
jgi:hypothetical protein